MQRFSVILRAIAPWLLLASFAQAQQVPTDPTSTHIFPAGARRGSQISVRVGGECLPPRTRFRITGDGVTGSEFLTQRADFRNEPSPRRKPGEQHINYPKEWLAEIHVSEDASPGPRLWCLACARGGTGSRVFLVGDLPEFIETESNSLPELAQTVELPITINGQIDGERDLDYYRFSAKRGQVIVADTMASRIGSPLEALVEFRDADRRKLPVQEIRMGNDPVVAFRVPDDGEYFLSVANLGLPGGPQFVYRITLSDEPFPRLAYPGGGTAGESVTIQLARLTGDARLDTATQVVALPQESGVEWWRPVGAHVAIPIDVGSNPEVVESDANDSLATAQRVATPITINGRFETARDEDWYCFDARAGQSFDIACRPAGEGLPSLPILSLHDSSGKPLATASAVDSPSRRPRVESFAPPADGTYFLRLRDAQFGASGGDDFLYRVSIQPSRQDFELTLKSDAANHTSGSRSELEVFVHRHGGFTGPVQVIAEGLLTGLNCEPLVIAANAPSGKIALTSADGTMADDMFIQIVGSAEIAGVQTHRVATMPHLSVDPEGVSMGTPTTDRFHLTVQPKPLFRLFCNEAYQYGHRGTIYPYLMQVERLNGFDGPIRLQVADRQIKDLDGIEVLEVTIPTGQNQIMLPVYLPETMHINVQAHSNVYAQGIASFKDDRVNEQATCVVSEMRCMIRTLPTVARLQATDHEIVALPGGETACHVKLDRTPMFSGRLDISLADADSSSCVTCAPAFIAEGETEGAVALRLSPNAVAGSSIPLVIRGTGDLGNGATVVTEARVTVRVCDVAAGDVPDGAGKLLGNWENEKDQGAFIRFEPTKCTFARVGQTAPTIHAVDYAMDKFTTDAWGRKSEYQFEVRDGQLILKLPDGSTQRYKKLDATPDELKLEPLKLGDARPLDDERIKSIQLEMSRRGKIDQEVRAAPIDWEKATKVDADNTEYLIKLVLDVGWIDAERFGEPTSKDAFLIVQHSMRPQLMLAALPMIEKDFRAKRIDVQSFTLLYDRLQITLGEKQRYGTQIGTNSDGDLIVMRLEDRAHVEDIRKEVGLFPLSDYLAIFRKQNKDKPVLFQDDQ